MSASNNSNSKNYTTANTRKTNKNTFVVVVFVVVIVKLCYSAVICVSSYFLFSLLFALVFRRTKQDTFSGTSIQCVASLWHSCLFLSIMESRMQVEKLWYFPFLTSTFLHECNSSVKIRKVQQLSQTSDVHCSQKTHFKHVLCARRDFVELSVIWDFQFYEQKSGISNNASDFLVSLNLY